MEIDHEEIIVETYRSGGNSWVNKPDNGVRITHRPTGLRVQSDMHRSLHRNKAMAMEELGRRLNPRLPTKKEVHGLTATDCIRMAYNATNAVSENYSQTYVVTGYLMAMAAAQTDAQKAKPWYDAIKTHLQCSDEYIATTILGG